MERLQSEYLFDPDVNAGKMIFLSGPRQVGKTYLVKNRLVKTKNENLYFNWDDPMVRRSYMHNPHFLKSVLADAHGPIPLVAFDEIHKHTDWKDILKGLYDIHTGEAQFMVTGSARLDFFKASGDSLVGRYFFYRLLPLGLCEALHDFSPVIDAPQVFALPEENKLASRVLSQNQNKNVKEGFDLWLRFGGFPEPFIKASDGFSLKWRRAYRTLLATEDLRDLTRIHDMKGIEQLMLILPGKIASPLSINSLREDLQVNHRTVANWLEGFKKIYLVFSLMPWAKSVSHAITKEEKYYFYDWTMVEDAGARFENLVAISLLRLVNRWNEKGLGDFDLRYVRNLQKQEVDFLLLNGTKPLALFEAKVNDTSLGAPARLFSKIFKVPYYQIVAGFDGCEIYPGNRYVVSAARFLPLLG
ncbi:MAG: ATP-binding protein [Chitinivibrionales bacterium]|nr:ATP-binding protein [Chitinivibrionales bacterium]